ncbi:MAG: hypothetical protein MJA30_24395, partial [Cytophagales bacterium]|nr:hypothetical protein [Cytophagales bacterium]
MKQYNREARLKWKEQYMNAVITVQRVYRGEKDRRQVREIRRKQRLENRSNYFAQKRDRKVKKSIRYKLQDALNLAPVLETDDVIEKQRQTQRWKATKLGRALLDQNILYDLKLQTGTITCTKDSLFCTVFPSNIEEQELKTGDWIRIQGFSYQIASLTEASESRESLPESNQAQGLNEVQAETKHSMILELDFPFEGKTQENCKFYRYKSIPEYIIKSIKQKRKLHQKIQDLQDEYM